MSFNFGPTLLSWLKENAPRTYRMILDGERRSRKTLQGPQLGHGAGLQPHHHAAGQPPRPHHADPLGHRRLSSTTTALRPKACGWRRLRPTPRPRAAGAAWHQVHRAGAAPVQAHSRRSKPTLPARQFAWTDTPNASVDTTRPYLVRFESGLSIAVFFYNGPASRAIAFEGLLELRRELRRPPQGRLQRQRRSRSSFTWPPTANPTAIITSTAKWRWPTRLRLLEQDKTVKLDQLRQLSRPVSARVRMRDRRQHFVELRPRRRALALQLRLQRRQAPDGTRRGARPCARRSTSLRDAAGSAHRSRKAAKLFKDVWAARDAYIEVILDRSAESVDRFFAAHQTHALTDEERVRALRADGDAAPRPAHVHQLRMVLRRHLRHRDGADHRLRRARAATGHELFGDRPPALEPAFLARLARSKIERAERRRRRPNLQERVGTMELDLEQVAAHYAIS